MIQDSPGATTASAVPPCLTKITPAGNAKMQTTTIFVKVSSSGESLPCTVPSDATTCQIRQNISDQLSLPQHLEVGQLIYQGRVLLQKDIVHRLKTYETLTLVDTSLNGGSRRLINESDDSDDDDDSYKPAASATNKSTSKVANAKQSASGSSKPTQKPTRNFDDDFTKVGDSQALHDQSSALFGEQDHAGLSHSWANTQVYAAELLKNPLGLAQGMVQPLSHLIINARKNIKAEYSIPEMNEALESLKDVIPDLKKKFDSIDIPEPQLNGSISQIYNSIDVDKVGYLSTRDFHSFCKYLFRELGMSMNEKELVLMGKAIDVNGDGKFDKDEIVRKFTREERKAWFAKKRASFDQIIKEKEEKLKQKMEDKKKKKEESRKSQKVVRSDGSGSEESPEEEDPDEDDSGSGDDDSDESERGRAEDHDMYTEEAEKEADDESDAEKVGENEEGEQEYIFGENCFYLLFRLRAEQQQSIKEFQKKMSEDKEVSKILDSNIEMLGKTALWFDRITKEQSYLLKAILQQAFFSKRTPCNKFQTWRQIIYACDIKTILHLILTLGPELFRTSLVLDVMETDTNHLLEIIESATCDGMLQMVMQTIDESASDQSFNTYDLLEKFKGFFKDANLPQKRLMLNMTNSNILQARWINQLRENELLDIVRYRGISGEMNFSLLALCPQEKVSEICQKLSADEKKQWTVWQQMQAVGWPSRDFSDLKSIQETLVRTINLPCDTRYMVQIPRPGLGVEGEFLRLEKQYNEQDATFELDQKNKMQLRTADSGYCLSLLKYSAISQQVETCKALSFSGQPVAIKTGAMFAFANAMLFTGEQGQVFWFTIALDGETFNVNMISDDFSNIKQTNISKDSVLHRYLSLGNDTCQGEYQEEYYIPQGEPKMIKVNNQELILFSHFQFGQKVSMYGFSPKEGKEVVQLAGACFFVHQYADKLKESDSRLPSDKIIVFFSNEMCAKPIASKRQFQSILDDASEDINMKRVTLDPSNWSSDELTVIEVLGADSLEKLVSGEEYSGKEDKELQKALVTNDSDWIFPMDKWTLREKSLAGGSFKASTHLGPDDRTFVTIENSNFRAQETIVYEVKGSNNLQAIFNSSKLSGSDDSTTSRAVTSGPKTSPKIFMYTAEEKQFVLLDLLKRPAKEKKEDESDQSGDDSKKEDSAEDSEEEPDLKNVDHMLVYASIMPDNLSMGTGESILLDYKHFFTPSIVDGVLLSSCLGVDQKYQEFQIREAPKDENDEEDSDGDQKFAKAKVTSNELNSADSWKVNFSYPLLACVNTQRADEVVISHMANGSNEQLQLKLNMGQFISFIQLDTDDTFTDSAFVSFDSTKDQTKLFILSLGNSFKQASILQMNEWKATVKVLPEKFKKLHAIRAKIKSLKLLRLGKNKNEFAIICQTQEEILFLTEKGVTEIFETRGDLSLSSIEMLCSQNGQNYFVTEELSSQTNFIYELSATYNEASKKVETSCVKVFTFTSGTVVSIQLNRDNEQMASYNYTYAGYASYEGQKKLDCKTDLMVLDSSNNLFQLSQLKSGANFVESKSRNLSKEVGLKQIVKEKTEQESIILSERTIIFRNQVLNIESGRTYEALNNVLPSDQKVLACQLVPKSDKIMYKSMNKSQLQLLFKRDAGRRNCNPVGFEELRDCKSVNYISKSLLLFEIRAAQRISYWTYVTLDEQIRELPADLSKILSEGWTQVESRIVRGNICQLLLINDELKMDQEKTIEKKQHSSRNRALILELTKKGNLLRKIPIVFSEAEEDRQVLQNFAGQLLQVSVKKFTDLLKDETESEPKVIAAKLESDGSVRPCLAMFDSAVQGNEYLYTGDYLCWLNPNDHCIKAIDLTKTKEERTVKKINFSEFIGKTNEHQIGISECKPYSAIRVTQLSQVNEAVLRRVANCVQLTLGNRAIMYNLNDETPTPVNEIAAMHHLVDPQNFVDGGPIVYTFETKKSCEFILEEMGIVKGNHAFAIKEWLEPSQFGNSIMIKQKSNLPLHKTHQNDYWFRPVLGIFKQHCEADLMEVQYLIQAAESGVKPKRIDIKTLWAQYGDDIIFKVLQGNLRILTAIRDQLEALELADIEDIDGSETYNPDLRRLSDILTRKTVLLKENNGTKVSLQSFLSMNLTNSGLRDAILKIGRFSPNFSILKMFSNQDDFKTMIKHGTPQTTQELQNCFYETRSTRNIQLLEWPRDMNLLTLRSKKCTVTKQELDEKLEGTQNRVTRAVNVKTTNLKWFYRDKKNFVAFTQMLQGLPNQVYASVFVESLLDQFWKQTQKEIIRFQFIPYLGLVSTTLWFFVSSLSQRDDLPEGQSATPQWLIWIEGLVVLAFLSNQFRLESYQFGALKNKLDYFKSAWNMIDFISLSFTLIIVLTSVFRHTLLPLELLRPMAAIASCTLMIKVFDWLRLFEKTAFYILLVEETMQDVSAFLILLVTALMMFGVPMVMLNLNRLNDNSIVDEPFGFWGLNMLLNQYLLALGEFNYGNFADQPQSYLCYIFFVLATFITQIAMLNMLIAIMGDTFERVIENRDVNATKTKLELMSDLVSTLHQTSAEEDQDCFMFIVQPDDDEGDEGDDWEGTVNKMTRLTANNINHLGYQLHKKSDRLQDSIDEFTRKDQVQDKHLKAHVDKIVKSSQKELNHKITEKITASQEMNNEKFQSQNEKFKAINATLSTIIDKLDGKTPEEIAEKKNARRGSAMKNALGSKLGGSLGGGLAGLKGLGAMSGVQGQK